jgi:hypothetical protein
MQQPSYMVVCSNRVCLPPVGGIVSRNVPHSVATRGWALYQLLPVLAPAIHAAKGHVTRLTATAEKERVTIVSQGHL